MFGYILLWAVLGRLWCHAQSVVTATTTMTDLSTSTITPYTTTYTAIITYTTTVVYITPSPTSLSTSPLPTSTSITTSTVSPTIVSSASGYTYQGFYVEPSTSSAFGPAKTSSPSMTVENCAAYCSGAMYFGVEAGQDCYCGNTPIDTTTLAKGDPSSGIPCSGDGTELCGGNGQFELYQELPSNSSTTSASSTSTVSPTIVSSASGYTYRGFYVEPSTASALGPVKTSGPSITVENCAAYCSGAMYFGLEAGQECYCGSALTNTTALADGNSTSGIACSGDSTELCGGNGQLELYQVPASITSTSSTTSTSPVSTISPTSNSSTTSTSSVSTVSPTIVSSASGYTYRGFYVEPSTASALGPVKTSGPSITVENCAAYCSGAMYFGVEAGQDCYCGNTLTNTSTLADSNPSSGIPCSGDGTEFCGGNGVLELYQVPTVATSTSSLAIITSSSTVSVTSTSTITVTSTISTDVSTTASSTTLQSTTASTSSTTSPSTTAFGTTTTATTTSSQTTTSTPAPTAPGTVSTCSQYYIVASGDTCNTIEARFSISDAQFKYWNPSIDSACGNLIPGDAYCVAGGPPLPTTSSTVSISSTALMTTLATSTILTPAAATPTSSTSQDLVASATSIIVSETLYSFCSQYLGYTTPVATATATTTASSVVTQTVTSTQGATTVVYTVVYTSTQTTTVPSSTTTPGTTVTKTSTTVTGVVSTAGATARKVRRGIVPKGGNDEPRITGVERRQAASTTTTAISTPSDLSRFPATILSSACSLEATPVTTTSTTTTTTTVAQGGITTVTTRTTLAAVSSPTTVSTTTTTATVTSGVSTAPSSTRTSTVVVTSTSTVIVQASAPTGTPTWLQVQPDPNTGATYALSDPSTHLTDNFYAQSKREVFIVSSMNQLYSVTNNSYYYIPKPAGGDKLYWSTNAAVGNKTFYKNALNDGTGRAQLFLNNTATGVPYNFCVANSSGVDYNAQTGYHIYYYISALVVNCTTTKLFLQPVS